MLLSLSTLLIVVIVIATTTTLAAASSCSVPIKSASGHHRSSTNKTRLVVQLDADGRSVSIMINSSSSIESTTQLVTQLSTAPIAEASNLVFEPWDQASSNGNLKISYARHNVIKFDSDISVEKNNTSRSSYSCVLTAHSSSSSSSSSKKIEKIQFVFTAAWKQLLNSTSAFPVVSYFVEYQKTAREQKKQNRNSIALNFLYDPSAALTGLGEQYNFLDLRTSGVNHVVTREQGVGRGAFPITNILNLVDYVGGSVRTNYAARPIFIAHRTKSSDQNNNTASSVFTMTNPAFSAFDFSSYEQQHRHQSSAHSLSSSASRPIVQLLINDTRALGHLAATPSYKDSVRLLTRVLLRGSLPRRPPAWSYSGPIIGMQGGTRAVLSNLTALLNLGCKPSAFWLQDWTGSRPLTGRTGLWWSWGEWNTQHYPGSAAMIATLAAKKIKTMTYVNPMLVNASGAPGLSTNPWATAMEKGYFVRHGPERKVAVVYDGGSMIDFTNPDAREWYVDLMAKSFNAGSSGFMADFGESLPLDAELFDPSLNSINKNNENGNGNENENFNLVEDRDLPFGGAPKYYHNAYPDAWFGVMRDAAARAGNGTLLDESFFFGRSAWLRASLGYNGAWCGDQDTSWDAYDGLASAVAATATGGLSTNPFTHSDIGGYTAPLYVRRSQELFYRWCEHSAFTTFMRTHDGSSPHRNWQFYRTEATRKQFVRYTQLFVAWLPLREQLVDEAARTGIPVVRPLLLEFPDVDCSFSAGASSSSSSAPLICSMAHQYLIGRDLLVAPVVTKGASTVDVLFPGVGGGAGLEWISIWNANKSYAPSHALQRVAAPMHCPAVFVSSQSPFVKTLLAAFAEFAAPCV